MGTSSKIDFDTRARLLSFALSCAPDPAPVLQAWQALEVEESCINSGVLEAGDFVSLLFSSSSSSSSDGLDSQEALLQAAAQVTADLHGAQPWSADAILPSVHPFYSSPLISFSSEHLSDPASSSSLCFYSKIPRLLQQAQTIMHALVFVELQNSPATNTTLDTATTPAAPLSLSEFKNKTRFDMAFDALAVALSRHFAQLSAADVLPWLLALKDIRFADGFFEQVQQSVANLNLQRYFYALRLIEQIPSLASPELHSLAMIRGRVILQPIGTILANIDTTNVDERESLDAVYIAGKLTQSSNQVQLQACLTEMLADGLAIDVFIASGGSFQKRREAVLQLCGGPQRNFNFALRLAEHFGLSPIEIYEASGMRRGRGREGDKYIFQVLIKVIPLTFCLSFFTFYSKERVARIITCGPVDLIEETLRDEGLEVELQKNIPHALGSFDTIVYPKILGTDYGRLGPLLSLAARLEIAVTVSSEVWRILNDWRGELERRMKLKL